jgi:hypothetical protein
VRDQTPASRVGQEPPHGLRHAQEGDQCSALRKKDARAPHKEKYLGKPTAQDHIVVHHKERLRGPAQDGVGEDTMHGGQITPLPGGQEARLAWEGRSPAMKQVQAACATASGPDR